MKLLLFLLTSTLLFAETSPLKALLIAGGCCHDYANQHKILSHGLQQRANIRVDVLWTANESAAPPLNFYKEAEWAKGYDLIIHDECAAANTDEEMISNIIEAHKTIPSVMLHCTMHSFRGKSLNWEKHVGLVSRRHGPHEPIDVDIIQETHPIMKTLKDWHIAKDELYHVEELYDAEPLAIGTQSYVRNGKEIIDEHPVAWINTKNGAPSFSTSLGHYNEVCKSDEYLTMVTRGSLWVCGKLEDPAYSAPYTGENTITEIPTQNAPQKVRLSASSAEDTKGNLVKHAIDGDHETRWCAALGTYPATYQLEFDAMQSFHGMEITWEFPEKWMQHIIETSMDGKNWVTAVDYSKQGRTGVYTTRFTEGKKAKHIRITALKQQNNMWASIREIKIFHGNGDHIPLVFNGSTVLTD